MPSFNSSFTGGGQKLILTDLEVDGTTLVVDETNNRLGIGTATPSSTLELESSSGDLVIEIDNNASNSANLKIVSGAGNARADLVLDGNNHITMKAQRVGIVSTNPQKTLDVTGDGEKALCIYVLAFSRKCRPCETDEIRMHHTWLRNMIRHEPPASMNLLKRFLLAGLREKYRLKF